MSIRHKRVKKKGQSTIEFILLVAGVIAIMVAFLGSSGPFRSRLEDTYNQATEGMVDMANRLRGSRPVTNLQQQ